jgi:hypothetical protein
VAAPLAGTQIVGSPSKAPQTEGRRNRNLKQKHVTGKLISYQNKLFGPGASVCPCFAVEEYVSF